MTLIMNNLAMSVSVFALMFSLLVAYLKFRVEMISTRDRHKKREAISKEMTEAYFDYHKWDK